MDPNHGSARRSTSAVCSTPLSATTQLIQVGPDFGYVLLGGLLGMGKPRPNARLVDQAALNVKVHAAGAFDVDFKSDVTARSRATPCSSPFLVCAISFKPILGRACLIASIKQAVAPKGQ